jgi:penicillin amidase
MKKLFKIAIISLLFFLSGCLVFFFIHFYRSVPKIKGDVYLTGLETDVKIIRDSWGIPHIFAQNEKDLFFACGYVHAQERMWQMELIRRAGLGKLSEILGRKTLERDRFIRTLDLKEAAQRDFEKLSSKMKSLILSYSQGVNAWMNSRRLNWPPEFLLLGCRPQPWNPLDSLIVKEIMALLLCVDYQSEILRAKLVKELGAQKALQILEEGIAVPLSEIEDVSLSEWPIPLPFQGSNNWVLAGSRTESGKPLLANDPHLEISLPPIWYEIHVVCPGLNAVGASLPGVPLVIIGHNESIAWGMTNSGVDVQDLYVEKLNSSKDMYWENDQWKPLFIKEEKIKIRGEKEPERIEVSWTERGPVVSPVLGENEKPISLSWTIYDGGRTMESFYFLNKAQNWQEFVDALKLFDAPSQNFVYADKEGNIGYYLNGKIPIRAEKAALFPYPAWKEEGRWQGFLKEEEKPNLYNPEEGLIVTANNKIIPDDFPHYMSFEWEAPFRAERIRELLLQKEKHNVETMKVIQNDIFSKKGELFLPYLEDMKIAKGESKKALDILKNWDLRLSSGKEAALYKIFMDFFHEEVFKDDLGEDYERFNSLFKRKRAGLLRILSDSLSPWFDKKETQVVEAREDIIELSLDKAYKWLEKQYGPADGWDWMKINSFRFQHSLGEIPFLKFLNRGPFPLGGDAFTIKCSSSSLLKRKWGVSYRQIIDLSDFRNSVCVLSSGESGHFLDRFYDNQIPLWLEGQYHPMLFDPEDIEEKTAGILILKPIE